MATALDRALDALARPPPAALPRAALATALVCTLAWVLGPLGGLSTRPTPTDDGNSTMALFNWHPISMIIALAAWTEAALQYVSPLAGAFSPAPPGRAARKAAHAVLHSVATVAAIGGLAAAWRSHTLKRPTPIPNLYSPHALAGAAALTAALAQAALGAAAFLWPGATAPHPRAAFGRAHAAAGRGVLVATAAAAVAGFAEKTAFVQLGKGLAGGQLRSAVVALPAAAAVCAAVGVAAAVAILSSGDRGPPEGGQQLATAAADDEF